MLWNSNSPLFISSLYKTRRQTHKQTPTLVNTYMYSHTHTTTPTRAPTQTPIQYPKHRSHAHVIHMPPITLLSYPLRHP